MAETKEKSAEKLILFNHSRNPYNLGKDAKGEVRWFRVGDSIECKDQAEFDMLRNYKGVSTTKQVSPTLSAHVQTLNDKISAQQEEIEALKKQNEKFTKGK